MNLPLPNILLFSCFYELLSHVLSLQPAGVFQGRCIGDKLHWLFLSGSVLIAPSFLKDSFAGYRILGWFFFSTLHILAHCLLTSRVSDEKYTDNLKNNLHMTRGFSLTDFKSLSLSFNSLILMSLSVVHWVCFT